MQVIHERVQALQFRVTADQRLRLVNHRLSIVTGRMARLPTPSCVISVPPSAALVGWTPDAPRDGSSQPFLCSQTNRESRTCHWCLERSACAEVDQPAGVT